MSNTSSNLFNKINRASLNRLSIAIRKAQENGGYQDMSLNAALLESYKSERNTDFHTFGQWKEKGFQVKDQAVPFLIWGKPVEMSKDEKSWNYFPVIQLYSNTQVEAIEAEEPKQDPEPKKAPAKKKSSKK